MDAADKMGSVFVCQKCQKPLKIVERKGVKDSTLAALKSTDPSFLDEGRQKKEADAIKQLGESFVVLSDTKSKAASVEASQGGSANFHAQVQALTKIFEVVSDKCQVDCPLCDQCNLETQQQLMKKRAEIEEEWRGFQECIRRLKADEAGDQKDKSAKERETQERQKVEAQVEAIKAQRELLSAETRKLEAESLELDEFERRFWEEYQEFQLDLRLQQQSEGAVEQKIDIAKRQLEQLQQTNVYDDAFYISVKGHFGTINGFKLGRLPAQPVGWDEINAALGQVVLLLESLAKQVGYDFKTVVLHPMGSYSKIADRTKPEVQNELYNFSSSEFFIRQGSSSSSAGKRFNTALSLLLRAVKELGVYGSKIDPTFRLPQRIEGDSIFSSAEHSRGGKSIQAVAAEEEWTKALKYMLIDLKALLAWCSKCSASGMARPKTKR